MSAHGHSARSDGYRATVLLYFQIQFGEQRIIARNLEVAGFVLHAHEMSQNGRRDFSRVSRDLLCRDVLWASRRVIWRSEPCAAHSHFFLILEYENKVVGRRQMSKDLLQIVRDGQHRASNSAASSTARWLGIGALGVAGTGIGATLLLAPSLLHPRDRAPAPAGSETSPQAWVKLTETTATVPGDAEFRALEAFMQTETGSGLIRVPVYHTVMYAHYAHTDGGFVVDSIYVPRGLAVPQFRPNISGGFKSYIKAAKTIIEKTNSLMSDFIGALQKLECSEAE